MIKPIEDRVLIKMKEENNTTKSGIILSTKTKDRSQLAEVIEVGQGKMVNGKLVPLIVKKGDNVIFSQYAGTEVKYKGEIYVIVKQDDILATY